MACCEGRQRIDGSVRSSRATLAMIFSAHWGDCNMQKGPKVVHTRAQVRVRMPDGLLLEGQFGAKVGARSILCSFI